MNDKKTPQPIRSFSTTSQRRLYSSSSSSSSSYHQDDWDHVQHMVRQHDPAGYLPGQLLSNPKMQVAYFAMRSFWVETGLRMGTTALVQDANATPRQHLDWWQSSIQAIYHDLEDTDDENKDKDIDTPSVHNNKIASNWQQHPTLRLLHHVISQCPTQIAQRHFDDILHSRFHDLDVTQYATLAELEDHALQSCGSLLQLVLEVGGMTSETNTVAHEAAQLVGKGHGLTNALRTSIPVVSTTGKLVIPQDLCQKYGVTSPRYLLSALGQGDHAAQSALQQTVQEISLCAQRHFDQARLLRNEILQEGQQALPVFLPALASETFLQRLQRHDYNLTDRNLRNVGWMEHAQCASRIVLAYYQKKF